MTAVAWSLIAFLALAPAWGIQYMVWAMAACYLIGVGAGYAYNITAGRRDVHDLQPLERWAAWYRAYATYFAPQYELIALMVPWVVLVVVLIHGTIKLFPGDGWSSVTVRSR